MIIYSRRAKRFPISVVHLAVARRYRCCVIHIATYAFLPPGSRRVKRDAMRAAFLRLCHTLGYTITKLGQLC
jgi:hypothetical protein